MEKKFERFLKSYIKERGIGIRSISEIMEEYGLKRNEIEKWCYNIEDILMIGLNRNIKYKYEDGNLYNILDVNNDAGNIDILIDLKDEDGDDIRIGIFYGFEYYSYFGNVEYLESCINELNNLVW